MVVRVNNFTLLILATNSQTIGEHVNGLHTNEWNSKSDSVHYTFFSTVSKFEQREKKGANIIANLIIW